MPNGTRLCNLQAAAFGCVAPPLVVSRCVVHEAPASPPAPDALNDDRNHRIKTAHPMTPPATSPTSPRTRLGTDYILNALVEEGLSHLFMFPAAWLIRSYRRSPGTTSSSRWWRRTRVAPSTWPTATRAPAEASAPRSGSADQAAATWRPRP